jgi:hypothetical protein
MCRLQAVLLKSERNQETHRREERLMLSAMYEIGVRIMDRNINNQVQDAASSSSAPSEGEAGGAGATVLSVQRAEQDKKLQQAR